MPAVSGRAPRRGVALLVVGLLSLPGRLAPAEESPRRNTVVAGSQYAGGGLHRLFFGRDYRDLWTTPVAAEILDLGREAGGLRPVRRVGGVQTKGDTRDNVAYPRHGLFAAARGTLFPEGLGRDGHVRTGQRQRQRLSLRGEAVTLALHAGGKRVFGNYPYMEAAQRMPGATVRGRRLRLGQRRPAPAPRAVSLLVPAHFGVFGFADAGRVWLEGEISGTWHTGFGGGVWFSLLAYRSAFSAGLAHGEEEDLFHVQGGFTF